MDLTKNYDRIRKYIASFEEDLKVRKVYRLSEALFAFGGKDNELNIKAVGKDIDESAFKKVSLPHDYAITQGFSKERETGSSGGYVISGVAWYRIHLSELDGHKRFSLLFDGAGGVSDVWINEQYMGTHPNGTTPFWFDITPFLDFDGTDVITVKCDTSLQPYSRFYGGLGLTRTIRIVENGRLHLIPGSLWARTAKVGRTAEIEVYSTVSFLRDELHAREDAFEGESNRSATYSLNTEILDEEGNIVASNLMPGILVHCTGNKSFTQKIVIENPELWSTERPYMYRVHTEVSFRGKVLDDEIVPLGIRTLEKSPEYGVKVNGKVELFKGVCLHQDSGFYGAAVPAKEWVRRFNALREMGCNAVRTAHHPYMDEFYTVADAMGFYVMDEAFDEWHRAWPRNYSDGIGGKNRYGYYLYFDQWARTDLKAITIRSRRHPSVIMLSLGNEIPDYYYDDAPEIYAEFKALCKKYSPDLWLTEGSEGQCNLELNEDMLALSDIVGLNYSDLRYHEKFYRPMHAKHPDWVMVGSENSHQGQHWKEIEKQPYATGIFIWTGQDYFGESGLFNDPVSFAPDFNKETLCHGSQSGKLDYSLNPKAQYFFAQSLWSEKPMVYAAVKMAEYDPWHFGSRMQAVPTWNLEKGKFITLYVMTNCDTVSVELNKKCIAKDVINKKEGMPVEIEMQYEPGILKVTGYNSGKKVAEYTIGTYGEVASVKATTETCTAYANGDIVHVDFALTDKNGNLCRVSDREIKVEVENGELYALASGSMGDASNHFGCDSFTAYRGRVIAGFKTKDAGIMKVKAYCGDATPAEVEIEVK